MRSGTVTFRMVTLADQVMSSVSNILAVVLVARTLSADEFGTFALGYTMLTVVLGLSRSYFGTRVALAGDRDTAPQVTAGLLGAVAILSPLAIVVVLVTSLLAAGAESWQVLVVVALATPVVCLQDIVRFGSVAGGRPLVALISDSLWVAIMAAPLILGLTLSIAQVMLIWLGSGVVALIVGLLLFRVIPRIREGMVQLRQRHRVGEAVTYSILLGSLSFFLVLLLASRLIDPAAAGSLRGASTALGPVSVLWSYAAIGLIPLLVRRSRSLDLRFCALTALGMAGVTIAWGAVLLVVPSSIGSAFFGESWTGIRSILPWTIAEYVVGCVAVAAVQGLKVRGCSRQIVRSKVPSVVVMVGGTAIVAAVYGTVWSVAAVLGLASIILAVGVWSSLLADHFRGSGKGKAPDRAQSAEQGGLLA